MNCLAWLSCLLPIITLKMKQNQCWNLHFVLYKDNTSLSFLLACKNNSIVLFNYEGEDTRIKKKITVWISDVGMKYLIKALIAFFRGYSLWFGIKLLGEVL